MNLLLIDTLLGCLLLWISYRLLTTYQLNKQQKLAEKSRWKIQEGLLRGLPTVKVDEETLKMHILLYGKLEKLHQQANDKIQTQLLVNENFYFEGENFHKHYASFFSKAVQEKTQLYFHQLSPLFFHTRFNKVEEEKRLQESLGTLMQIKLLIKEHLIQEKIH